MTQVPFEQAVDELFLTLEEWLEKNHPHLDFEFQEGILTIALAQTGKCIVSRQAALQQVWLATPLGAYRFHATLQGWQTSSGQALLDVLNQNFQV